MVAASFILLVLAFNGFTRDLIEARIPVKVNAAATVSIQPLADENGTGQVKTVAADTEEMFEILFNAGTSSAQCRGIARNATAAASVRYGRGTILITLQPQTYGNAVISLYSINGKRVLRGALTNSAIANRGLNLSKANVAAGVYLLSIKSNDGNAFSTKVMHNGGRLNINAAFGGDLSSSLNKSANSAATGTWTITTVAAGYVTDIRQFTPEAGLNPVKNITLSAVQNSCEGFTDGTEREHFGRMKPQFCDERDGQKYVYVTIGSHVWMAENLNYDTADGTGSWCYGNNADNCAKYGRLYTWDAAITACPAGWRLPDTADWRDLVNATGDSENAGTKLKSTSGWTNLSGVVMGNGTDELGFSALPGGYYVYGNNFFAQAGAAGWWWSATEYDGTGVRNIWSIYYNMYYGESDVVEDDIDKFFGLSVRCVRDK